MRNRKKKKSDLFAPNMLTMYVTAFFFERVRPGQANQDFEKAEALAKKLVAENPPCFASIVARYRAADSFEIEQMVDGEMAPHLREYGKGIFPELSEKPWPVYSTSRS